jgi:hypothetical protein
MINTEIWAQKSGDEKRDKTPVKRTVRNNFMAFLILIIGIPQEKAAEKSGFNLLSTDYTGLIKGSTDYADFHGLRGL